MKAGMSIRTINFREFLGDHVPRFLTSKGGQKHLFVGNEAADADSIVSSLCYAYHNYQLNTRSPTMDRTTEDSFIPIVSIKRNELHLRRDVDH